MHCCNAATLLQSFGLYGISVMFLQIVCCFVMFIFLFVCCSVEDYASPRMALFVTLTKTFLMEAVVIGIIVAFWVKFRDSSKVGSLYVSYLTIRSS